MKNKLVDLNDHLFAQLERLNDESLKGDELKSEIERSKAMSDISKSVIMGANLQLDVIKIQAEYRGFKDSDVPKNLIGNDK